MPPWKGNRCFPDDLLVRDLPANAGDMGLIPDLGGSHLPHNDQAHVPQLLSLDSRAWELQLPKPTYPRAWAPQEQKPLQRKACAPKLECAPTLCTGEKPSRQWRPSTAKNKQMRKKQTVNQYVAPSKVKFSLPSKQSLLGMQKSNKKCIWGLLTDI